MMTFPFYILVGMMLGPTGLGFTPTLPFIFNLCAAGFLFAAGLECSFVGVAKQSKSVFALSLAAFALPFLVGYQVSPLLGISTFESRWVYAIALSVSALPVIIQILKDRQLIGQPIGQIIIAVASVCDILAWTAFLFILPRAHQTVWIQSHFPILMFLVAFVLKTLVPQMSSLTRSFQKVSHWVFAPLFFIGVGLQIDLWKAFPIWMTVTTFLIATLTKVTVVLGIARLFRYSTQEAWIIAIGLNARGALEILLAQVAFESGLIDGPLRTILIFVAVLTSMIAGPCLKRLQRPVRLLSSLS